MTTAQAREMYDLRTNRAWSWYELARRYGTTEREMREVYRAYKRGTLTETITDDDTNADALEGWMHAIYASGEQMGLDRWANYHDALATA